LSTFFVNNKLREYRESRRWTQADLANAIDVTELTIRRWERGHVVPSAYHVKKLCAVFQTTPEELGFVKSAQASNEEQTAKPSPDELSTAQPTQAARVALATQENQPSEQDILLSAPQDRQHEETLDASESSDAAPAHVLARRYEEGHVEMPRRVERRWLKPVLLVCLCCALIASGLVVTLFVVQAKNAHITPREQASPTAKQSELYRADWSHGFDHWSGFPLWQWSQQQGGMLTTSNTVPNNVLFVPYHPSVASYVVKAQIQRIAYSGIQGQGQAFGIIVRLTDTTGYICGLGSHFKPEHFFIGQVTPPSTSAPYYSIADRQTSVAHLDTQWHMYSVIVTNTYVSCLLDGVPIFSVITENSIPAGDIGIYVDTTAIAIKSFVVTPESA
jgi:DNA-binding XRE family transcriptional regulator